MSSDTPAGVAARECELVVRDPTPAEAANSHRGQVAGPAGDGVEDDGRMTAEGHVVLDCS